MEEAKALLSELTVLDLTDEWGQLCGKIFADLGAQVVKVEPPGGDKVRHKGPFVGKDPDLEKSIFWLSMNTGKKSITVDLETDAGRKTFHRLSRGADFVLESFSPGYLDNLGLSYRALSAENPGLIMVAITPFGQTGPYSQFLGSDLICMALSGEMNLCGNPDDRPLRISIPQAFFHASLEAAAGALFALWHRHRTGKGQFVDVSAQESIIWEGGHNHAIWYTNRINITREGAYRRFGHLGRMRMIHPCKDGYIVMYQTGGRVYAPGLRALIDWMDSEGMANDFLQEFDWENFTTANFDEKVAREQEKLFHPFFRSKTKKELWERGLTDRIVLAPVCTTEDIIKSDHFRERNFWVPLPHPESGQTVLYPGSPYKSSRPHYAVRGVAPRLGQDNESVLGTGSDRSINTQPLHEDRQGKNDKGMDELLFEGLKILDLSWIATGPSAVRFFADYGATVIRVESRSQTDVLRIAPPYKDMEAGIDRSSYFALYNSNKYGMTVNLKNPQGLELIKKLVAWADVVTEAFAPRVIEKIGLGYDVLRSIKPDIIMASTSQLGATGVPFRGFGAHGAALAGFWSVTGYPGGEPSGLYGAYCDYVANRYLVVAITMALEERRQTGQGQHIDQSQIESSLTFLAPALLDYVFNGVVSRPQGNRDPNAAPHNAYPCRGENRWCAIAVTNDEQWEALKGVMGHPDWAEDERFATLKARKENEDELDRLMDEWTSHYECHELMVRLQEAGVPAGVVAQAEDLHQDPQLIHRGHFMYVDHPVLGSYASDLPAFRLSLVKPRTPRPSPCLGEHNEFVVKEILDLSNTQWEQLKEDGAFGVE
jgi:crotonobetainyl-CoA:carnitine CoA-transferase CaiB-like acyl-CoA transferase